MLSVTALGAIHFGNPEKLFAGNRSKDSLQAVWIGKGGHQFRYPGWHGVVLASVNVTRSK